jgi:hypothetical protein
MVSVCRRDWHARYQALDTEISRWYDMRQERSFVTTKTMTLRLAQQQAEALEAIAHADGVPVAEAVRTAISAHIEQRRADKAFQKRLRVSLERNRRILEELSTR